MAFPIGVDCIVMYCAFCIRLTCSSLCTRSPARECQWRWIWFWSMEREREDRASACSGPCGMVFTSPCNANGLGHTDTPYTRPYLFRSRARRSTVAHAGEPSTYASSFYRTEPRRGAMGRDSHQGLRASGNRPGTGHLPEDGLILPERLHKLLGVAVLLLRLPARLVDVAT